MYSGIIFNTRLFSIQVFLSLNFCSKTNYFCSSKNYLPPLLLSPDMEVQILFFTFINPKWVYTVHPATEPVNFLENSRIRKQPVFCNMSTLNQESNLRYNQLIDEANNLCFENGAMNGWLVFLQSSLLLFQVAL